MLKKQTGITLVALVITIIVLLILAGVSISMVIGNNGVLTQASDSVMKTKASGARQAVQLALQTAETKYYADRTGNSAIERTQVYETEDAVKTELENQGYTVVGTVDVVDPTPATGETEVKYNLEITDGIETYKLTVSVNNETGAVILGDTVDVGGEEVKL